MPDSKSEQSRRSAGRRFSRFTIVVCGLAAGIVLVEAWARIYKPIPRRQMIRGYCLRAVDGVPVWGCPDEDHTARHNRACVDEHPERTRVLFFGSSITYGSALPAAEAFTTALQARLNEQRPQPGFCVMNFAEPGFAFEQKLAVARAEVARYKPALVMWEDWVEWMDYTLMGETAYGTGNLRVRPDGFIGIKGIPDPLNRFLLLNSRFYEFVTLIFAEETPGRMEEETVTEFANQRLIKVKELTESVGARLVLYLAPALDRSFAETEAALPTWHRILLDFAQKQSLPVYPLQRELMDQDYLAIRMDPCCHYNAEGHKALVPIMQRIILRHLDGP